MDVNTFYGVRFAEPPARFQASVPASGWAGTLDATQPAARAMQADKPAGQRSLFAPAKGRVSEDCLFLNIHAPASPGPPRPVLVWIHGGGFTEGSANQFDGTALALTADAVVVAINYRLGLFALTDLRAAGEEYATSCNAWFGDQTAALQWVCGNIDEYGGDPSNVTILGESAGGTSVIALAAFAAGEGLFQRAIASSPAFILDTPSVDDGMLAAAMRFSVDAVPEWLLAAPAEEIVEIGRSFWPNPFIDGVVFPESPHQAIGRLGLDAVPMITGYAPHEGLLLNTEMLDLGMPEALVGLVAQSVARLGAGSGAATPSYIERLRSFCKPAGDLELSDVVWTDLMRRSSMEAAELTARAGAKAWHYLFDVPCVLHGVHTEGTHCVDIPFTFNSFRDPDHALGWWVEQNEANRNLAVRWVGAISAFARTDHPGEALAKWPEYTPESRQTLRITPESCQVAEDVDGDFRRQVWAGAGAPVDA